MKPDMSAEAVSKRLRRVSELVRVCHALAGPRRKPKHVPQSAREDASAIQPVRKANLESKPTDRRGKDNPTPKDASG
jgi:hypothetical protein